MRTGLLLIAVWVLSACDDETSHAPLSRGGGGPEVIRTTRPDAGETVDDDDAGRTPDAGGEGPLPLECARVNAVRIIASEEVPLVTSIQSPDDFNVTRQAATWRGDCTSPSLVVELSNGVCPNGAGHELEIALPVNAIADGQIGFGVNFIEPELEFVESIRVRYTRPAAFRPVGVWGTCGGGGGQISFFNLLDRASDAMNLQASFELTLAPCDGGPGPAQLVSGYFDVHVQRSPADFCPP